jgi:hypothetical protein
VEERPEGILVDCQAQHLVSFLEHETQLDEIRDKRLQSIQRKPWKLAVNLAQRLALFTETVDVSRGAAEAIRLRFGVAKTFPDEEEVAPIPKAQKRLPSPAAVEALPFCHRSRHWSPELVLPPSIANVGLDHEAEGGTEGTREQNVIVEVVRDPADAEALRMKGHRAVLPQPETHLAERLVGRDEDQVLESLGHVVSVTPGEPEDKVGAVLDSEFLAVLHDLDILNDRGPLVEFPQES